MNETITIIYEPNQRHKIGVFKMIGIMFTNIYHSKELILQLFIRDFFAIYKKSYFGIGWLVITPLVAVISWVFMNKTGVLNPGDVGIPYPAYVLLSTSIWNLFKGYYVSATETLGAGAGFIMQVKYPHEVLLIKQTAQHLAGFFTGFIINIAVLLYFDITPSWKIIFLPFISLPLFFLGAGLGLIVSVFKIVAEEIQKILDIFLNILIYLTPVIYSPNINNILLQKILKYNPLTYLIGASRDIIIYGRFENYKFEFLIAALVSLSVFLFAWRIFFLTEEKVIEKMI
ncbi:MAG: hypothetical protein A2096_12575 [Spirochaetes bacterium GWF1_41_5]|nr:MAG: hypothetical protein A2096_12575 [Spirochaetes bacterium GWF1_41_5]HBE01003.1 hypothetical protein [Spirochaetia bacterium]